VGDSTTSVNNAVFEEKNGEVRFSQEIEYKGKKVPLHCNSVKLFYKDNKFVGVSSNLIDPKTLNVSGAESKMTKTQIAEKLSKDLHVARQRINVVGQCVYLVNGDPKQARIVSRANVQVGGKKNEIEILVDGETGKVLDVE
jgi:hypothetical protein